MVSIKSKVEKVTNFPGKKKENNVNEEDLGFLDKLRKNLKLPTSKQSSANLHAESTGSPEISYCMF